MKSVLTQVKKVWNDKPTDIISAGFERNKAKHVSRDKIYKAKAFRRGMC